MAIIGYPPAPSGVDNNGAQSRGWGTGWPDCQVDKQATVTLANGARFTMRREVAPMLRDLLDYALLRYEIRKADSGGFNCRAIVGSDPPVASNHSWGLAVDINWNTNPLGGSFTDIPKWMVSMMWAHGWYWGGWYQRLDVMHFEYVGRPADVAAHAAAAKQQLEDAMPTAQEIAAAVWEYVIVSGSLGNDKAGNYIKQGKVAANAVGAVKAELDTSLVVAGRIETALMNLAQAPAPVQVVLSDEQLDVVAERVAARLVSLRFTAGTQ